MLDGPFLSNWAETKATQLAEWEIRLKEKEKVLELTDWVTSRDMLTGDIIVQLRIDSSKVRKAKNIDNWEEFTTVEVIKQC